METTNASAQGAHTPGEINQSHAFPSKLKADTLVSSATIAAGGALTDHQQEILEKRGINVELATRMGWRSGRSGYGEEIQIPYYRNGKEVNCKTRTIEGEKKFHQVSGAEKCFYNVDAIKDLGDAPLVITEGEMDCLIALQCGHIAVSVPDGAPKEAIGDKETVKYDYLADIPQSLTQIILAVDSDGPGVNLMNDLALRLGRHRCKWVKYPKGCKDLNDAFTAWGARGVGESLQKAQFMKIHGLYLMDDLPPAMTQPALSVGIDALREHYRMRTGDFSVITGIPSHGKSTFANQIAFNMAKTHGWNVCFASFEQPPQTEHREALRTLFSGRPSHLVDDLTAADRFIQDKFCFIVPDDESDEFADMTWLKDRMAAAVTRYNAKLIIVDPWNEMDHVYDQNRISITQYVGKSIKELKRFARRFNVHVMVIAHPAKMKKDKDGVFPIPTPYDISDSSHWYNKPEQVLIVHRQEKNTLIRIAKSRYHRALGKPGDVEVNFDDYTYRYA